MMSTEFTFICHLLRLLFSSDKPEFLFYEYPTVFDILYPALGIKAYIMQS